MKTKLAIIEQRDEQIARLTQEQDAMKKQVSELLNLFKKHTTLPHVSIPTNPQHTRFEMFWVIYYVHEYYC